MLQQAGRGKVIGDRAAGITGQPLAFDLLGGETERICTMKCRYIDGSSDTWDANRTSS